MASKRIDGFTPHSKPLVALNKTLASFAFCSSNVSYKHLIKRISAANLASLFFCLLIERKIILIACDYTLNGIVIECLLDLL